MQIAGYLKTSLIEWPGKITSVIFTPGCNFRCPFCHNGDLVLNSKPILTPEKEVLTDLAKRKKWADAVVITGGEPTLQPDLKLFLKKCKKLGFLTMVHTNGNKPEIIQDLIKQKLVDFWAMDLKGNFEIYDKFTGIKTAIEKIKKSLKLIAQSKTEFELRTTVVPTFHDQKDLLVLAKQLGALIGSLNHGHWFLQQFRPINCLDKKYLKMKPYSKEELTVFLNEIKKSVPQTFLRGV